jgi:hypothetical protein
MEEDLYKNNLETNIHIGKCGFLDINIPKNTEILIINFDCVYGYLRPCINRLYDMKYKKCSINCTIILIEKLKLLNNLRNVICTYTLHNNDNNMYKYNIPDEYVNLKFFNDILPFRSVGFY